MTAGAHLLLVIVATTLAVAGVWAYWRQRVYGVAMDSVEAQLRGLDLDQLGYGPAGAGSTLVGDWGQAPTVARLSAVRPWSRGLAVEIIVKGAFPGLSARSRFNAPEAEAGRSLPVGDPAFDALALVQPEGYEVLVRLTRPTRAALGDLLSAGWTLRDGDLVLAIPWALLSTLGTRAAAGWRTGVLKLQAAQRGTPPGLAHRLLDEPMMEVRFRLLRALADEGAEAVKRHLPASAARDLAPHVASLASALLGDGASWDLQKRWAQDQVVSTAPRQIARLHQRRRDEAALLAMLQWREAQVLIPAVEALAAVGGREAVPHLLPLAGGRVPDREVVGAAREAISRIQARLGEAELGQVELVAAPVEAGRVQVVAEGGEIGVVEGGQITIK